MVLHFCFQKSKYNNERTVDHSGGVCDILEKYVDCKSEIEDAYWHLLLHPMMGKFLRVTVGKQGNSTIQCDAF